MLLYMVVFPHQQRGACSLYITFCFRGVVAQLLRCHRDFKSQLYISCDYCIKQATFQCILKFLLKFELTLANTDDEPI